MEKHDIQKEEETTPLFNSPSYPKFSKFVSENNTFPTISKEEKGGEKRTNEWKERWSSPDKGKFEMGIPKNSKIQKYSIIFKNIQKYSKYSKYSIFKNIQKILKSIQKTNFYIGKYF